ncbi:hypothetical protein V2J09_017523, partial [Rumex salicifolius]
KAKSTGNEGGFALNACGDPILPSLIPLDDLLAKSGVSSSLPESYKNAVSFVYTTLIKDLQHHPSKSKEYTAAAAASRPLTTVSMMNFSLIMASAFGSSLSAIDVKGCMPFLSPLIEGECSMTVATNRGTIEFYLLCATWKCECPSMSLLALPISPENLIIFLNMNSDSELAFKVYIKRFFLVCKVQIRSLCRCYLNMASKPHFRLALQWCKYKQVNFI